MLLQKFKGILVTYKGFHGTNADSAIDIIDNEIIISSDKDQHDTDLWLGDGFYLFEDDFYSFKWIAQNLYRKVKSDYSEDRLKEEYEIIEVDLDIEKDRIFDLSKNLTHRKIFESVLSKIKQKTDDKNNNISDGLAINYLFNVLEYDKIFDVVHGCFIFNEKNYVNISTRFDNIQQQQFCLRNLDKIVNKDLFDFHSKIEDYLDIWQDIFYMANPYKYKKSDTYVFNIKEGIYEP